MGEIGHQHIQIKEELFSSNVDILISSHERCLLVHRSRFKDVKRKSEIRRIFE